MTRYCLKCSKPLKNKNSKAKFCTDSCRVAHHQKMKRRQLNQPPTVSVPYDEAQLNALQTAQEELGKSVEHHDKLLRVVMNHLKEIYAGLSRKEREE